MEYDNPIYDFSPLKEFLKKRGYTIGTRKAYEPFTPEDVKAADITNGSMSFTSEGIFVKGDDGVERQVFLYKKDYRLETYGKPRFHICRCSTIEDFIRSGNFRQHYVRANSEPVPVYDKDNGIYLQIDGLPLCNNCRRIISRYGNISSTEFVELLKSANDNAEEDHEEVELDLFGYTKDWDMISKQYREKHDYTCENCGLKIADGYDKQFIHVHHIDGDKLNNKENNLKCLCLKCHAHVDANHLRRLTNGANKYVYDYFMSKYHPPFSQWSPQRDHSGSMSNITPPF